MDRNGKVLYRESQHQVREVINAKFHFLVECSDSDRPVKGIRSMMSDQLVAFVKIFWSPLEREGANSLLNEVLATLALLAWEEGKNSLSLK